MSTDQSEINAIRSRFYRLVAAGVPRQEAARRAHEGAEATDAVSEPGPAKTDIPAKGDAAKPVEIPVGWAEIEWPELRTLATSISGKDVRSRKEANELIEAELARRAKAVETQAQA
jgi:hypothetical protein